MRHHEFCLKSYFKSNTVYKNSAIVKWQQHDGSWFQAPAMPPHWYVEENGSAAMLATKRLAGVTPEGYQWPHKNDLRPPKIRKKRKEQALGLMSRELPCLHGIRMGWLRSVYSFTTSRIQKFLNLVAIPLSVFNYWH